MGVYAVNGARMYIGGAKLDKDTDFVEGDFAGESWVEIGGLVNMGEVGDSNDLITANLIAKNRTKKAKGTANAGSMALVAAADWNDEGQQAMRAAQKTSDNFAFKIVFNDAPPGGTPSERKFIGLVMGARNQFNEANSILNLASTIEVNSNIVPIEAAA